MSSNSVTIYVVESIPANMVSLIDDLNLIVRFSKRASVASASEASTYNKNFMRH